MLSQHRKGKGRYRDKQGLVFSHLECSHSLLPSLRWPLAAKENMYPYHKKISILEQQSAYIFIVQHGCKVFVPKIWRFDGLIHIVCIQGQVALTGNWNSERWLVFIQFTLKYHFSYLSQDICLSGFRHQNLKG